MHWSLWLGAIIAAVLVFDQLMLAAERRGWVYWRKRVPTASSAGNALMSVAAIFEPGKQHVVAEDQRRQVAGDDEATPTAGGHPRRPTADAPSAEVTPPRT